ncbi:DIRP domain, partial [Dillenia turbinata]
LINEEKMAPARKSRSVNKRFSHEASPDKDGDNLNKSKQKKRKLSDMLGTQWSKEELERFYEAYRKYGRDWKKVAAAVRNRSVEMVEALYTMNRAYLSLPEGTASVVGLIAMMTDHYSVLEGSDSEQDSIDGIGTSRRPQKRGRGKLRPIGSKGGSYGNFVDLLHSQPVATDYGCLSLLKKRRTGGSRPRAVGKRTPRFPIAYPHDRYNSEKYFSPTRKGLSLKDNTNDDDVFHKVALALAEASQKGGSPQVSRTPNRRLDNNTSSPFQRSDQFRAGLGANIAKPSGSETDEERFEGSSGSMEADNGDYGRDRNYSVDTEDVGTAETQRKGKKVYEKKAHAEDIDDLKEACSGTEGGLRSGKFKSETVIDVKTRSSYQVPRKKSKKVLFQKDESSAFDALKTLADLSLMMPSTAAEADSSVQDKEANNGIQEKLRVPEAMPAIHRREKPKTSWAKAKGKQGVDVNSLGIRKSSSQDVTAVPESKEVPDDSVARLVRRKRKSLASKTDSHLSGSPKNEATHEEKKLTSKGKRSMILHPPQGKSLKPLEFSSSDCRRQGADLALSGVKSSDSDQISLPTKVRSRRKMDIPKPLSQKELKHSANVLNGQPRLPNPSYDKASNLKGQLSNCLLSSQVRRWCVFEWFYSAIDYPWFAKKEFVEYLNHVRLGHVQRLTRVEWGVIRSSLGKPRRFSEQFLKEEKDKLNQYRESVRTHYAELRAGVREGLPKDLSRPLSVGQRVIAIHPRTREIHDGSVLTVDHSRCRIQFDKPDFGVEFVLDIDCMPLNPSENMPASLTSHGIAIDLLLGDASGQSKDQSAGYKKYSLNDNQENVDGQSHQSPAHCVRDPLKQGGPTGANLPLKVDVSEVTNAQQAEHLHPAATVHGQAKEADVQALFELTRALDKKEAVVSELRRMNDEFLENQKDGDNSLKDSEPFKKQYAAVLVQLNEVNEQVSSALFCLRQRNTYQGNPSLTWMKPLPNYGDSGGLAKSLNRSACQTQELGSHIVEIVQSSRNKARTMVDKAMQAMSDLKECENSADRIEEAIDYVSNQLLLEDPGIPAAALSTGPDLVHGSLPTQDQLSYMLKSLGNCAPPPESKLNKSELTEAQIPSDLIAQCVATLLMIQKCTERQFPPADVAQILDSAVTNLQPCCSQNLPIYTEIQRCMGIIRNQILALLLYMRKCLTMKVENFSLREDLNVVMLSILPVICSFFSCKSVRDATESYSNNGLHRYYRFKGQESMKGITCTKHNHNSVVKENILEPKGRRKNFFLLFNFIFSYFLWWGWRIHKNNCNILKHRRNCKWQLPIRISQSLHQSEKTQSLEDLDVSEDLGVGNALPFWLTLVGKARLACTCESCNISEVPNNCFLKVSCKCPNNSFLTSSNANSNF